MTRLIEALKLMACDAETQIAAFPDGVVVADEIALIFDDELRAAALEHYPAAVREGFRAIDATLSAMASDPARWTIDGLRSAEAWHSLRASAAHLLAALGCTIGPPDLGPLVYVIASRRSRQH